MFNFYNKLLLIFGIFVVYALLGLFVARGDSIPESQVKDRSLFEEIIEDYRKYLATVPKAIRDEIMEYRNQISDLNKQKSLLYNRLSQESQQYLLKEQEFKKKLSLDDQNISK